MFNITRNIIRSNGKNFSRNLSCTSSKYFSPEVNFDNDDKNPNILITGGRGQLGRGLAVELSNRYGYKNVTLSDINFPSLNDEEKGHCAYVNVADYDDYQKIVIEQRINWIIHLPALLSATCESNLPLAKKVNIDSLHNAFEIADKEKCKLFVPSSIGAFGPTSPLAAIPDQCIQDPTSFYGVTKVYAELLGNYYAKTRGMDFRCLRYPGIISPVAEPGGGTTDYAVDIFHKIVGSGEDSFTCYLKPDARLPMMLEDDCIKGTCDFLAADEKDLSLRVYNLAACDFTPKEIAEEIKKKYEFDIIYQVDPMRQAIADSWPKVFLDENARKDWGWVPQFDTTEKLAEFMISKTPRKPKKMLSVAERTDKLVKEQQAAEIKLNRIKAKLEKLSNLN